MTQFYTLENACYRFYQLDYFVTLKVYVKIEEDTLSKHGYIYISDMKKPRYRFLVRIPENFPQNYIEYGHEYLVTLYNKYHDQFMNLELVAIHKDMDTGKEFSAWDKNFGERAFEHAYKLGYRTTHN